MTKISQTGRVEGTRIAGIGSYQPERVVTNDELSKIMDTDDEWISSRVGIKERRFAAKDETVMDMAVTAGTNAVNDAGIDPSEVDTVILPTCTMPYLIPNAAAQVADRIGAKRAGAFDLNAACAGFCYGVGMASDLVKAGTARTALVIGSEKLTDSVDPVDRANAIIFADGAGAAVVTASDEPRIGPVSWGSYGDMVHTIGMREGKYIYQEGQTVFRWATTKIAPIAMAAVDAAGLKLEDIDVLIPHQANLRIVDAIAKKLRAKGAREDMVVADDIVHSGNTSSASIPMALDHMRADGVVTSGNVVLAVGFGAGLSYAGQVFIAP